MIFWMKNDPGRGTSQSKVFKVELCFQMSKQQEGDQYGGSTVRTSQMAKMRQPGKQEKTKAAINLINLINLKVMSDLDTISLVEG